MIKQSGHVSHVVFLVHRENLQKYADRFTALFGIETPWDGPKEIEQMGSASVLSFEAGILLVSPLTDDHPLAAQLNKHGEGIIGLAFGTESLEAAVQRVQDLGVPVYEQQGELINDVMVAANGGPLHDAWPEKYSMVRESLIEPFLGMKVLALVQIEPRDGQS